MLHVGIYVDFFGGVKALENNAIGKWIYVMNWPIGHIVYASVFCYIFFNNKNTKNTQKNDIMSILVTFKQTNTQKKKGKQTNKINKGKNQQK